MIQKRGERAAPPPRPGGYALRFATNDAAKGWEGLCRQAPANLSAAVDAIEANPCPAPASGRQHRLKGSLAADTFGGKELPQWQYEVRLVLECGTSLTTARGLAGSSTQEWRTRSTPNSG